MLGRKTHANDSGNDLRMSETEFDSIMSKALDRAQPPHPPTAKVKSEDNKAK